MATAATASAAAAPVDDQPPRDDDAEPKGNARKAASSEHRPLKKRRTSPPPPLKIAAIAKKEVAASAVENKDTTKSRRSESGVSDAAASAAAAAHVSDDEDENEDQGNDEEGKRQQEADPLAGAADAAGSGIFYDDVEMENPLSSSSSFSSEVSLSRHHPLLVFEAGRRVSLTGSEEQSSSSPTSESPKNSIGAADADAAIEESLLLRPLPARPALPQSSVAGASLSPLSWFEKKKVFEAPVLEHHRSPPSSISFPIGGSCYFPQDDNDGKRRRLLDYLTKRHHRITMPSFRPRPFCPKAAAPMESPTPFPNAAESKPPQTTYGHPLPVSSSNQADVLEAALALASFDPSTLHRA
eukprot:CAMPEP_0197441780 /NCGR_PEP_ID=MMETSP1175-20131217/7957_1 /TAXON_ID=1003142 /ORGANISM="Triceratium dubium, Strain CCMP147" /LENGTH=354 /DNA_ID=CAMNT_0042972111 /DNA_START=427 /DNA_END=1491 /DNA_ORIENTATION=+